MISGTTSQEIDGVINKLPGDLSYGFQPNVNIPMYKGTDEIVDLSTTEYAEGNSNKNCDDRTPAEEAAYQAAYKTALAAAKGGASASEAKAAAMSAVYGTGQGNQ